MQGPPYPEGLLGGMVFCPLSTDPCAKGAGGFISSCGLHVLFVALTVSTIPPTRDSPYDGDLFGKVGASCSWIPSGGEATAGLVGRW